MELLRSLKRTVVTLLVIGALSVGATFAMKYWNSRNDAGRNDGVIVDQGDLDAFSIRIGDCFLDPAAEQIEHVTATPCAEPHDYQAYYIYVLTGSIYPGTTEIDARAQEGCLEQLPANASETLHTISWIVPSPETWAQIGDRQVVCTIGLQDGSQLTGSLVPQG